jgi:hypothetical protein
MSHTYKDRNKIKHSGWKDKQYKNHHINRKQLYLDHRYFEID